MPLGPESGVLSNPTITESQNRGVIGGLQKWQIGDLQKWQIGDPEIEGLQKWRLGILEKAN